MADQAHEWTDERIDELADRFRAIYAQAAKEMQAKLKRHMEAFDEENKDWKARVLRGDSTKSEYEDWLKNRAMDGQFISALANRLAQDAHDADKLARDAINDMIPTVYAENAAYGAYQVESGLGWDTHSFDLYDVDTVRRLMMMDEYTQIIHEVIPMGPARPRLQSLRVDVDAVKDVRWNRQKFTSAITQSILQGESVPNAAKRLMTVLNMDRNMATRAARTAMTSAENAGRVDSYERAKAMGIELEQQWMATLDERTRYSHRELDGQHVPVGRKFVVRSNGHVLDFPGDPKAHPSECYCCRCTLVAWMPDIEQEDPERWSRLPDGMTYDEWKAGKQSKGDDE